MLLLSYILTGPLPTVVSRVPISCSPVGSKGKCCRKYLKGKMCRRCPLKAKGMGAPERRQ